MSIDEFGVPAIDESSGEANGDLPETGAALDPRRWFTLAVVTACIVIIALDSTILNVSLPTMVRDLGSTVPTLQWVITGYALTLASLLLIGGRLGDLFGHRRMFIIGAGLFGFGSLLAALAGSVPQLIIGESLIEGIGAALMMPASLAILSNTFSGHERAVAFGVWGAVAGASGALGPVLGGVLTSNASWRWSFGINVIVAPLAIAGAVMWIPKSPRRAERPKIDLLGAGLVSAAMFLFIFGVTEGSRHGWLVPRQEFSLGRLLVWPTGRPVSISIVAFVVALVAFVVFHRHERRLSRSDVEPLFDFDLLQAIPFRNGLAGAICLVAGTSVLQFVLPLFLQDGKHLSAQTNGLWQFPLGLSVIVGAQIGARGVRRFGAIDTVRTGMVSSMLGLSYIAMMLSDSLTFWRLLPGLVLTGLGIGCGFAQLTNIAITGIRQSKMGVASAANAASRHLGSALGVAVVSTTLVSQAAAKAASAVRGVDGVSPAVRADALASIHANGIGFSAPASATPREAALLDHALADSLAGAGRLPLILAVGAIITAFALVTRIGRRSLAERPTVAAPAVAH